MNATEFIFQDSIEEILSSKYHFGKQHIARSKCYMLLPPSARAQLEDVGANRATMLESGVRAVIDYISGLTDSKIALLR